VAAGHRHAWFLQADHQTGKAGGRLPSLLVAKRRGACRRARTRRALHPGLSWAGGLAMHDAHQAFRAGARSAPWTSLEAAVASPRPRRRGCSLPAAPSGNAPADHPLQKSSLFSFSLHRSFRSLKSHVELDNFIPRLHDFCRDFCASLAL